MDASINLLDMVPPRLAKNQKLHRHLASWRNKIWVEENGILLPNTTLPFDSSKLDELFRFIVKGLLWYHWKVLLTQCHFVRAGTLTSVGEKLFWNLINKNANNRVSENLGDGTIQYEGVQDFDCPQLSGWKIMIYGGVKFGGDPNAPTEQLSLVWGLTSRNELRPEFWNEQQICAQ